MPRREERARSRDEDDIEPAGEAADLEEELEAEREAAWDLEEEREERTAHAEGAGERVGEPERRRSRRRRRRRGGERPAEGRSLEEEQRPARAPASSEAARDVDGERDEAAGEEEEDQAVGVPAHKKIPTWEDAVRILIDANMAARAQQPDRGRGYGRGRSGR
jgi:ribonuclease E